jgi:hypothetical protein
MRARSSAVAAAIACCVVAARASAEPKPKPFDIKPHRDQLVVLQDANGGTYVVRSGETKLVFFGAAKAPLYQQMVTGGFANGDSWGVSMWTPRADGLHDGQIVHKQDGSYSRFCLENDELGLTEITGDKAKQIIAKSTFMTTALVHLPLVLARDDTGAYYYVDRLNNEYGGKGYRLYVGKKGAMKQLALADVATDTAGLVFSTKVGDLSVIHDRSPDGATSTVATWVRGDKRTKLLVLDTSVNSPVIYKDMGVYSFTGTLCDEL